METVSAGRYMGARILGGKYLNAQDSEFIDYVTEDLERFVKSSHEKSVMLFPPVNNYRRHLISKLCEECFKQLRSLAVGQGQVKRIVVCHVNDMLRKSKSAAHRSSEQSTCGLKNQSSGTMVLERQNVRTNTQRMPTLYANYCPPTARHFEKVNSLSRSKSEPTLQTEKTMQRHLDIQLHVLRSKSFSMVEQVPVECGSSENLAEARKSSNSVKSSHEVTKKSICGSGATEKLPTDCPRTSNEGEYVEFAEEELLCLKDTLTISDPEPLPGTVTPPNRSPEKCKSNVRKKRARRKRAIAPGTGKDKTSAKAHPSNDYGGCLDSEIMKELTQSVRYVNIEKPQSNYDRFITGSEDAEFAHVVEIYNFPPGFNTQDLLTVFSPYKNSGFTIRWVDEMHVLGVFSSSQVAADVLAKEHPPVKTRPVCEASPKSRLETRRSAEFLQPYKRRPQTCVALARRLIAGALGLKITPSPEKQEAELKLLQEAREEKRLAAQKCQDVQQQYDASDGTTCEK